MGKSLSAQGGGDRTERLALGFPTWHGAPPSSQGNLGGVGGKVSPAQGGFPGRIQGVGLTDCSSWKDKASFPVSSQVWFLPRFLVASDDKVRRSPEACNMCLALLCTAASKPNHPACHLVITILSGGEGLPNPQLPLIFGIPSWILDVHQEAASMHFN